MIRHGTPELLAGLRIDPEFEGKIPPLQQEEFEMLRENILEAGEVYEPIRVWEGVVIDGHNRLKVIREHQELTWAVRDMDFVDKWAAFEWVYKNQLGRRNLTDENRTYVIGKLYEARKKSVGAADGFRGNQHTEVVSAQNEHLPKQRTAEQIAKDIGVGKETVKRAEKFAQGVDIIREVDPEFADKVLSGKAQVNKGQIASIARAGEDLESRQQAARDVKAEDDRLSAMTQQEKSERRKAQRQEKQTESRPTSDTTAVSPADTAKRPRVQGRSAELRELYRTIDEAYRPMIDPDAAVESDIGDLEEEIRVNGEMFVSTLRSIIDCKKHLIVDSESKQIVFMAIANIIQDITKMRGELLK